MEKIFKYCDRCNANLTMEQEGIRDITISCDSNFEGKKIMKEMLLCDFCYNQLIGFVGSINPFNGMYFNKSEI